MTIFVNDAALEFTVPATLPVILDSIAIKRFEGIAVAVNNEVVPKAEWNNFTLKENDKILVIRAFQGG